MRKVLFGFLNTIGKVQKLKLKLRGISEEDVYNRNVLNGKVWEEYCDNLKAAGAALLYSGTPKDPQQQAEGLRYLSRLTRGGLEAFVEFNDPSYPVFRRTVHETIKMGADNPDNYYLNAQIDGSQYDYVITGKRNSIHYLGLFTQNGNYATTGGLSPCGVIDDASIQYEKDGSFTIHVSKNPRESNWLKITEESSLIMVRQTYLHRHKEKAVDIEIKAIGGPKAPKSLTPKAITQGLQTASMFVGGASYLFSKWANGFQKHTNQLPLFDPEISNAAGGDKDIIYYHSHWKLKANEALVITVKPPECRSWNFQLNNYWMESLDYRYHNICISKGSAIPEKDGSLKVIVSHANPHLPNWIETAGHFEGTMCWRWYKPEGTDIPEPQTEVIIVDDL